MNICVLGAGVVGVTASYCLLKQGYDVTLVDALEGPGKGASHGNGGQLSYSYVAPLADPSVWTKWPYYLFSSESPLAIRPSADPAQWKWLISFLRACTARRAKQTTVDLLRLAFFSKQELSQLLQRTSIAFHHRMAGKLVMYADAPSFDNARAQVAFQAEHGCRQRVLSFRECLAVEPALAGSHRRWVGGVYTENEEVGDCALFCKGLVDEMSKQRRFRFQPSTRIRKATTSNGRLTTVETDNGSLDADAFVLAMGADSARFARQLGFSMPVYPLKGYSITVPLKPTSKQSAPRTSITDLSRKIVYARIGDHLRVAGRVELVGTDERIPPRAIRELTASTAEMFPDAVDLSDARALSPWAGFRPATPTGLPIIGASPVPGLYLNVGHGSLGWTLACGSAALLAAQIAGRTPPIEQAPYLLNA